jgi:hypothetical protein
LKSLPYAGASCFGTFDEEDIPKSKGSLLLTGGFENRSF